VLIGDGVAPGPRLAQDVAVAPNAPVILRLDRPVGPLVAQNAAAQADLALLESLGVKNVRVNQQQLSGGTCRVGICRPDVQGTLPDGRTIHIEYDTGASRRGPGHADRILRNDPEAIVILRTVG
jgi:hypothetical protein